MRRYVRQCLILLAAITLAACGAKQENEEESVRYVKTTKAIGVGEESKLSYPGRTKSSEDVNVAFRVSGTIQRIVVNEGDYVRKGQLIAIMDPRDYQVQLAATQAEYEQVKADAERVMALYAENNTTASNYDKARYGLEQITQKLANHRNQLADTRLVAPISGYVQMKLHESGETVSAGMPVVSMFNDNDIEVEVFIPASDFARRDRLVSASCSFTVMPDQTFPLEVVRLSKEANASQLYMARLRIKGDYDHSRITPGMTTMVYVSYADTEGSAHVKIPTSALYRHDGKTIVYVLDEKTMTIHARSVKPSKLDLEGNTKIIDGLRAGEVVVTAGVRYLTDGQKVKEYQKTSEANVGGLL